MNGTAFLKIAMIFALAPLLLTYDAAFNKAGAVERAIGPSGEPVPRYESLKSDKVNVRRGPGRDHKILWVFKKLGMPVKIVSEYEEWREIEDQAGSKGWIYYGLLSRRRTGITRDPADMGLKYFPLYEEASQNEEAIAKLGRGVIVHILTCSGSWCEISVNEKLRGWIAQNQLWGLFDNEPLN